MDGSNEIFKSISNYYDELVNRFGHSPKSCDYGTEQSQQIKFTVIAGSCDFSNQSVLDVGCGFADFSLFLNKYYKGVKYTGLDISEAMIANATALYPKLNLIHGNFFEREWQPDSYDYVTANGIFYLLQDNALPFMKQFIEKAFQISKKGLIFNSLSSKTPEKEKGEFYANPGEILELCLEFTPWVRIRHDYHHRDFTCFLFKEKQ